MKSYLFLFFTVLAVIINYTYAEDKEICDLSVVYVYNKLNINNI